MLTVSAIIQATKHMTENGDFPPGMRVIRDRGHPGTRASEGPADVMEASQDGSVPAKPLFVPLAARWYDAFESGMKDSEYRRYGRGWNERTCAVGRRVVLSRGDGTRNRMTGVVTSFRVVGPDAHPDIRAVYPDAEHIAEIGIRIDGR